MKVRNFTPALAVVAAAAGATLVTAPAKAQTTYYYDDPAYVSASSTVDEVVVPGRRLGPDGPNSLSRAVSLRDLDLTTAAGRDVMNMRIRATARDLCRALGEDRSAGDALGASCEDQAVRSARTQAKFAVNVAYENAAYNHAYAYQTLRDPYGYPY